jgi:broad specificity phosphatase PhoE
MELIIVRHGETKANIRNIIQGQTHGNLSDNGRRQALLLAKKLKGKKIDVVFSSDLRRASDTAYEIASQHDIPVYHIKWLRGRNSGLFEGKRWDDIVARIGKKRTFNSLSYRLGGGESMVEMRNRIAKFVTAIKKAHKNDTVLVCTHRHCIAVMLSVLFDVPLSVALSSLRGVKNAEIIENAGFIRMKIDGSKVKYIGNNRNVLAIARTSRKLYIS